MNKKIGRLLQPSMGGYLMVMMAFTVAAALFQNYILAGAELVITAVVLVIYQVNRAKRRKKLQDFLQHQLDEMNGITGVIIGGTSMAGGSGTMVGTIIGVFIMSVLKNGLSACGLQAEWQTFFTGIVVIGAVLMGVINQGMNLVGVDSNYQKVVKGLVLLLAVVFDVLSKRQKR